MESIVNYPDKIKISIIRHNNKTRQTKQMDMLMGKIKAGKGVVIP